MRTILVSKYQIIINVAVSCKLLMLILNKPVITEHENDFRRYIDSVRLCFDFLFRLGNMKDRTSFCIRSSATNLVEYFENPPTICFFNKFLSAVSQLLVVTNIGRFMLVLVIVYIRPC